MRRTHRVVTVVAILGCLLGPSSAGGQCIPTPSGLISYWPGDVGARDVFGGHDGVLVNGAQANVPGQVGGAFSFDGDDDFVDVASDPDFDITDALTLEAWVYLTEQRFDQKVLSYYLPYEMGVFEDKLELLPNSQEVHRNAPGGTVLQTDTWYHVAATWDGATITSYVNGVTDRVAIFEETLDIGTNNFSIGRASNGGIYFVGLIDEAALYDRALTAQEVEEHYLGGLLNEWFCIIAFIDGFESGDTSAWSSTVP